MTVSSMQVAGVATLQRIQHRVVVIELPEGGQGWVVLDSAVGSGAGAAGATVVVVAMEGETGSSNAAALMTECMPMCSS
jgi:hypothetical protein